MDFHYLQTLRRMHPAWRLLASAHAPMVAAFLHRSFIEPNQRTVSEQELSSRLEDFLYHLREQLDAAGEYPLAARDYLTSWANDERGWLRKYYPPNSDEPHYDLTPATEKALQWLAGLERQRFVGAESRLLLVFDLLRQIVRGAETDPQARIRELEQQRAAIDAEIEQIRAGRMVFMDPTQLRERFMQMAGTARGLLGDFRQLEQNFRELDRQVREQVASWEGGKGEVLDAIFGERDAIADSDQGRSFRAFWDFLMSPARQEELGELIERVLELEPVAELEPDRRLKRIHYDWLEAGEVTQRTVARLSEQLRRYLDDQAWLENRRIMGLLRDIEQHALSLRAAPPTDTVMELDEPAPRLELAMERPLYSPPVKPQIQQQQLLQGDSEIAADALFEQAYVDRERLRGQIRLALRRHDQISLGQLLQSHPLEQGLAELVTYLSLASDAERAVIDDSSPQIVTWTDAAGLSRRATIPLVIFSR